MHGFPCKNCTFGHKLCTKKSASSSLVTQTRAEIVRDKAEGDEGENSPVNCFRPRSNENRELKKRLRPDTLRKEHSDGIASLRASHIFGRAQSPTKVRHSFDRGRRDARPRPTDVHGRPTTKYDGIYAREIMRSRTRIAASAISFAHSAARSAVKRFG